MNDYRTLGCTGLRVSPLGLGVMTYGWGADKQAGRAMFDSYRARGGNFFDTADAYTGGESRDVARRVRARRVRATRWSLPSRSRSVGSTGHAWLVDLVGRHLIAIHCAAKSCYMRARDSNGGSIPSVAAL
jgi:hypothetical protein